MIWASVDPGQVHVGVATWVDNDLIFCGELTPEDFIVRLATAYPAVDSFDAIVIEDFTLAGPAYSRAKAKQARDTIELIGMVKGIAHIRGMKVFLQQPSVRHVAQKSPFWREVSAQVSGNSHVRSAVAHGVYFSRFNNAGRAWLDST